MNKPVSPLLADILIVDDTPPNVQLLAGMLRHHGYTTREAINGPMALDLVAQKAPDLVLLDVRMPGMDGYEVCRRIKANPLLPSIPVIFVSALGDQTDKLLGFAAGGVDYITKPFDMKEVLARVKTHLTIVQLQKQLAEQNAQLQNEITYRQQVEQALHQTNEALERRVEERTALLTAANLELNHELNNRKQIERQLEELVIQVRNQARQVHEIINTVPEGLLLLRANSEVAMANPSALRALEKLAPNWPQGRLTRLGDRPIEGFLETPPTGTWHTVEKDGSTYEIVSRMMIDESDHQYWVMVLHNATEELEIQRRLQQQDRLAAVGQMAAGIAHDFNNILAVIILYTDLAMRVDGLPAELGDRLQTIALQSRRASELITQILDFSRRNILAPRPMDLLPFIKEQVKMLERTMPENIRIALDSAVTTLMVEADPTRLQQAILNLSVNARDAMPDGGLLTFRIFACLGQTPISCVTCGDVKNGDWVCIEVSDTGTGIAPATLAHIFEPFFTTKAPGRGTGLGLAQVYGIAKSHSGHIAVESSINHGSVFSLYLPLYRQPSIIEPAVTDLPIPEGCNECILLVEDEAATRSALVDALTLLHYKVTACAQGQDAMRFLRQHLFEVDLILSDVVMPELGGVELLRNVRGMGLTMPIILMTGHALQEEMERLQEEGLTAYLLKPPRIHDLATILASALKGIQKDAG